MAHNEQLVQYQVRELHLLQGLQECSTALEKAVLTLTEQYPPIQVPDDVASAAAKYSGMIRYMALPPPNAAVGAVGTAVAVPAQGVGFTEGSGFTEGCAYGKEETAASTSSYCFEKETAPVATLAPAVAPTAAGMI